MVASASDVPTIVLALFIVTALSILVYYLFWKVSLHNNIGILTELCIILVKFVSTLPTSDMCIQRTHHNIELYCHNADAAMCYSSIVFFYQGYH